MQPGGDDGGIVAEKGVPGPQIFRQIPEMTMFEPVFPSMDHQQAGSITAVGWLLGDEPVR